jgi:hypothetical protein
MNVRFIFEIELKTNAGGSSKMSVIIQRTTWRNIKKTIIFTITALKYQIS